MRLIIITPDKPVQNETTIVNEMFAHGLQRLHVRKPSFTAAGYREYIGAISPEYGQHIVIHGSFDLYDELQLGGVHLSSFLRDDPATWDTIEGIPPTAVSTSFHSWQEIESNAFAYGYVFISPVFDSISKAGYMAGIDLAGVKALKGTQKKYPEIIGLGGVGAQELKVLADNGFDGGAMLGSIWQSRDPIAAFINASKAISSLQDR